MNLNILTGFLLCFCFLASISISQSASSNIDTRLRFRRQDEDAGADANADADENAATTGESDKADANEVTTGSADGDSDAATDAAAEGGATEAAAEGDAATEAATEAATDAAAEGGATEAAAEGDAATEAATEAAEGDAATESATQAAEGEAATEAATEAAGNGDTTEAAAEGDAATESATEAAEGGATTDAGAADTTAAADGDANDATTASADEEKASQESGTDSGVTVEETTAGSAENGTDVSVQPNETEGGDATASADATTNAGDTSGQTIGETVFTADNNNVATSQVPDVSETADNDTSTEAPGAGGDADTTQPSAPQEPAGPGSDARAELRVVVSPATLQVQRGRTVEITCTVYGGSAETSIYWIQDEPERRYAVTDEVSPNDRQVTQSQVSLRARITLDDPSKIGKYTCMAQDNSGNSGSATLTMEETGGRYQPPVYPGYQPSQPQPSGARAYLRIVAPDMRDGDYVEIQCEGAAAEDESRIEWYFNGRLVNDEQPLFPRGKTLYIRPISRGYLGNYRCSIPGGNYMEANSVLTFGGSAPQQPVQPSQPVTGRCSIDEATCRNGRCIPRSYLCDGKDDCGDSSDESCGPASGTGGDSCQPNEISCSDPGRGRKCVQKFWMCDGDRDCDDGSDEQPRYCDLLARPRFCKTSEFQCASYNGTSNSPVCIPRSFQCDGYNDCPDRSDEIGCTKPTIISPPQRQIEINAGSTLTIQCTARGSPAPYINWRLNWGHICRDGHDNGRCQMTQAIDPNDPTFVTGTLTIRNVNINDGGAYSCEALNNQGFIFAIPDAIVNVIIGQQPPQPSYQACNCNGHSTTCTPDGRCLNCQHNTAGTYCEYCATGYQGDARRATAYDCQPITPPPSQYCDPSGTYSERGGRCICKYNVEGDRCDQCKRNHFYLNPGTPNGCLPCFCSGVSSDCSSSDWKRKAVSLSLNNWNAVPKNFATEQYEAGNRIQQRAGGRELALDQSSLGRPANEVLYWKAPKEILGDFVTLYDGNIDIDFVNDGDDRAASNNDEFIWLRGNNIDLVHKVPQGQQLKGNANETYSVACNERTFTRKDGTYIDRENILMALSDVDTFLIKINPAGGRRNAVLRNVRLNLAAADGYADNALTVESCRCPANYTGTSCEKCAEGYGRPHPLVGIYLGQCWSCRSICNDRADRCDRDTGKCQDCQGNTEGDRCEKCRAGFVLDARSNQCVQDGQYQPSSQGVFYIDSREYDPRSQTPFNVVLDGSKTEQRIPLRLNTPTRSVVWGRTDGNPLPNNVFQDGNDLVFRYPSSEQSGHYICTITFPDGTVQHLTVQMDHNQGQPSGQGYGSFNPASPLTLQEGSNQYIQAPSGYGRVQWSRADGQPFAGGVYQNGNDLQITGARPEHGGIYICALYNADGSSSNVPYEVRVQAADRRGGAPKVTIQPKTINLKEGQRMIIQYTVASHDPIKVAWYKWTDQGYQPIPSLFSVEENRLVLNRATLDAAGTYQVVVRNSYGEDRQTLEIKVQPRRGRARGQQAGTPIIRFSQDQYEVGYETIDIAPNLSGGDGATITWTKDGSGYLPDGVTALNDGTLRVAARSSDVDGRYNIDVTNAHGRSSASIYIRWRESSGASGEHGNDQDRARTYADVRFESRDEQSHQVGRDIHLQCNVQTHASRPYEYTYSKDGHALENNVEVHPNGLLIIRNAQASDSGRYRCEVSFPRAPDAGTVESSYDLRFNGGASSHGYQYGADDNQQYASDYLDVTAQPSEAVIGRGQTANITCVVNGAQQYTITWGKYAHDTTLPDYARQQGNSVIVAPGPDAQAEDMYLQCQVDVPGRAQPHHAYARVNIRDGDESSKKMKKKRRS